MSALLGKAVAFDAGFDDADEDGDVFFSQKGTPARDQQRFQVVVGGSCFQPNQNEPNCRSRFRGAAAAAAVGDHYEAATLQPQVAFEEVRERESRHVLLLP